MRLLNPQAIEDRSFEIILGELGAHAFEPPQLEVVKRVIHATADFEFAGTLVFHPEAVAAGISALRDGTDVVADVQMVAAGVNRERLQGFGGTVRCFIADEDVAREAKARQVTRAIVSMGKAAATFPLGRLGIVAIGNAPTALLELLRLTEAGQAHPRLIIGVPVGFVSAAEAKALLEKSPVPHITCRGRKGGSTVAVAILNALMILARQAPPEAGGPPSPRPPQAERAA